MTRLIGYMAFLVQYHPVWRIMFKLFNSHLQLGDSGDCRYEPANRGATDSGKVEIRNPHNETELAQMIAYVGPIAISIDASQPSFRFYGGGK